MGWEMLLRYVSRSSIVFLVLLFLLAGTSHVLADQVTLTYIDANANAQTIVLDCNSSREDLALAASLIGQEGVVIVNDPNAGCGTLAEIAAAVSAEAPLFAPGIAEAFAYMSYDDAEMIASAINEVPGVNTVAVQSAVNLELNQPAADPQTDINAKEPSASLETADERRASRN